MRIKIIVAFLGASLLAQAHASLLQESLPNWCVVNAQGQVADQGGQYACSAPPFTAQDTSLWQQEYANVSGPLGATTPPLNVVPFVGSQAGVTIPNMVPSAVAQGDGLQFAPVLTEWQYIFKVVYFGGSESGGQVQLPPPNLLRTAHRDDARVLGTVFFSPSSYGGSYETSQLTYFLQDRDATASLLQKVARTYDVDGFFFNEETPYPQNVSVNDAINLMLAFQGQNLLNAQPLDMEWYYVGDVTGNNDATTLMQDGGQVSKSAFIDYSLVYGLPSEVPAGYPPSDVEYGFDASSGIGGASSALTQAATQDKVSFAVFAFNNYLGNVANGAGKQNNNLGIELSFWQAAAAAGYTVENTPAYPKNFSTSFNLGEGFNDYYVNGVAQNFGQWSDIGLQDYLPLINTTHDFVSQWDFQNAFDGGSSLAVQVNGATTDSFLLYQGLNTPVQADTVLHVTYQPVGSQSDYQLCLGTSSGASACFALDNDPTAVVNNWYQKTWQLNTSTLPGAITSISLKNVGQSQEQINLAQIYVGSSAEFTNAPQAPSNVVAGAPIVDSNKAAYYHHIVTWNPVAVTNDNNVHYRLYAGSQFLGETTLTTFDIVNQDPQNSTVCVEAVNGAGANSSCVAAQ